MDPFWNKTPSQAVELDDEVDNNFKGDEQVVFVQSFHTLLLDVGPKDSPEVCDFIVVLQAVESE